MDKYNSSNIDNLNTTFNTTNDSLNNDIHDSLNHSGLVQSLCNDWFCDITVWGNQTCKKQFDSIKSTIYNVTMGYFHSSDIMRHILVEIPNDSKILDVGIGTGFIYSQNNDLIKRKNIHITGIDTDDGYIKSAKHAMIDVELESNTKLIIGDIYGINEDDIGYGLFDYVFFIDSYSVLSDVHSLITYCERYLKPTGMIVVGSVLFDQYDENIDWIKQHLVYVSSIQFGNMMLKNKLEDYIKLRCSNNANSIKQCFRIINSVSIPGTDCSMKTYIVKWRPDIFLEQ